MKVFTVVHVLISLVGIFAGLVSLYGLIVGRRLDLWTATFLIFTALTSITGFGFAFDHLLPSHKVGIISLVILAIAIPARYIYHMVGKWRPIYVITSTIALYLNVFVLVVQLFLKVPALKALAPTGSEPPFLVAQITVLLAFILLGALATIRFRPQQVNVSPLVG